MVSNASKMCTDVDKENYKNLLYLVYPQIKNTNEICWVCCLVHPINVCLSTGQTICLSDGRDIDKMIVYILNGNFIS